MGSGVGGEDVSGSGASLSGTVTMPTLAKKKKRLSRGREYRSRQGADRSQVKQSAAIASRFDQVVISAHPRSFEPPSAPLPEPAVLEQIEAAFVPRVLPITVGTTVNFVNMDEIYHNVFSLDTVK